jgi:hypothetical protein
MGLARAAGPKRDDVLAPLDPFAAGQFQHLHLVELRDRLEVEAVEALGDRELCRLDAALDLAPIAVDHLAVDFHSELSRVGSVLSGNQHSRRLA